MRIEELISNDQELISSGKGRYLRGAVNDSLVVDIEKQVFYWNSRGIAGNSLDWLTKIKMMPIGDAYKVLGSQGDTLLPILYYEREKKDFVVSPSLVDSFFDFGKTNRDYWLYDRGYTHSTIDYFRLGFTGEWYTIPIWVNGRFKNFQCRKPEPKRMRPWYKGMGALPFNLDILSLGSKFCVLTEGPPDTIMLHQNNIVSISQTVGSSGWKVYRKYYMKFYPLDFIYICYDNDKAGDSGSVELAYQLFGSRAKIYNFWDFDEGYDVSDYFNNGGNKEEFMLLLQDKSRYPHEVELYGR
ncbi:MAG: toprim domain-containing protein [Candidatus Kariarchaeaceae archaeon]